MEDIAKNFVDNLTVQETKFALIRALKVMQKTLKCDTCPMESYCFHSIEECYDNMLDELLYGRDL